MTYLKLGVSALMLVCLSFQSFADENNGQQDGGVLLGASRVIYPGNNSRGVTLTVSNQVSHPFLVKSMVLDESRQHGAPFIVTPPLFRLDGGQRNTLTITRTGGRFPADREALNWLCVSFIPPKPDSVWDENKKGSVGKGNVSTIVQVVPGSCIKLLVRPPSVQGDSVDVADKVFWSVSGKTITATNPTPFYMNISQASFNGKNLTMDKSYIPPFSDEKYPLPGNEIKGTVKWSVIGDYGETREKTFSVK
ncbi:TPA: molecular chaperone [Salmonella enterica subsp. enterica serovar Chester]|nr:molecular chaperone [Salmonella enterica subsp. enterica serovar Chester]EHZ1826896.1 molecular chaperone [Salmonella enterica subsp. enterica serovar Chester]